MQPEPCHCATKASPNKQLERTKGAMLEDAAPFAAQLRRWADH